MLIAELEEQLLGGSDPITFEQALAVMELPEEQITPLVGLAHRVRLAGAGPEVELESIISAKTGGCPEDCAFCSQSRLWPTPVRPEPFLDLEELVTSAQEAEAGGATEFCIVLAIRGPDERIMAQVLEAISALHEKTTLNVACSLGLLTQAQARVLAEAGVHRYNHNLETARSFFPSIATTHTWDERRETCLVAKDAGMELCCGGILGMGETSRQRVEFAMELRDLDPCETPINFLNPRPGTPLADRPTMHAMEAIRSIALFRLVLPRATLRYAGGREVTLGDLQSLGMLAGINGLIMGNYLTTLGRSGADDLKMLADLNMPVKAKSREAKPAALDPPRNCPDCGARLRVQVLPAGWRAACPKCSFSERRPD